MFWRSEGEYLGHMAHDSLSGGKFLLGSQPHVHINQKAILFQGFLRRDSIAKSAHKKSGRGVGYLSFAITLHESFSSSRHVTSSYAGFPIPHARSLSLATAIKFT